MHESVTINENIGIFTAGDRTDDEQTAASDQLQLEVSPHKAYIRGHEIERYNTTFITVPKARDFESVNAGITVAQLGNFINITSIYGNRK